MAEDKAARLEAQRALGLKLEEFLNEHHEAYIALTKAWQTRRDQCLNSMVYEKDANTLHVLQGAVQAFTEVINMPARAIELARGADAEILKFQKPAEEVKE